MRSQFSRKPFAGSLLVITLLIFSSLASFNLLPLAGAQSRAGQSIGQAGEHTDPDDQDHQHGNFKTREPDPAQRFIEARLRHEFNKQRLAAAGEAAEPDLKTALKSTDINDVAVIEDDGRLVIQPNSFDLTGRSVLFTPSGNGYTVAGAASSFDTSLGTKLDLTTTPAVNPKIPSIPGVEPGDDAYIFQDLGFNFSFYGTSFTSAGITSNGCLVFRPAGMSDTAFNDAAGMSGAPASLSELLKPLPRIAPFWHDLDARAVAVQGASGIYIRKDSDRVVITWNSVRDFPNTASDNGVHTFQATLFNDGRILFNYSSGTLISDIITGLSPGSSDDLSAVNFFNPAAGVFTGGMAELFTASSRLDDIGTVAAFYSTHPGQDNYDFVYIFYDFNFTLPNNAFAFYASIRNSVTGIGRLSGGQETFDFDPGGLTSGSTKMQGYLMMANINLDYPTYPTQRFLGANSALSILGQEQGHRWLSRMRYPGANTNILLGRDSAHWSYFLNIESTLSHPAARRSSSMEGSVWNDNGNGTFTSVNLVDGFSRLDQYVMGLRPSTDVPDIFVLTNLTSTSGRTASSGPQPGITVTGTKQTVTIDQIIQQNGARNPDSTTAPKDFRAAIVLLTRAGTTPSQATLDKVTRFRLAWESYFGQSTDYKGSINTGLAALATSRVIAAVSAANYSSVLTPGGIGAIFGSGMATATQSATTQPLPTTLGGVQVLINGTAAALYFVSPTQINFQIPASTSATVSSTVQSSAATIEIMSNGQLLRAGAVQLAPAVPAIFTADASGSGPAAAIDGFTFTSGPFNAKQTNGQPNIIAVYGSGLGSDATDVDGNVNGSVAATIDGNPITVDYAGRAPGFTGLNQYNIVLPATITSGNHTLVFSRSGIQSNPTIIAIK